MKYLFLILSFYSFTTLAVTCQDLKIDLLAVEDSLQNSYLKMASGGECCEPCMDGMKDDCKNGVYNLQCIKKKDLEALYNSKMAELIIAEGIHALALGIETNHNALNDLTKENLKTAEEKIIKLEESLQKANLLYLALFPNKSNDKDALQIRKSNDGDFATLLSAYSSSMSIEAYISKQCASSQFSAMSFCSEIKKTKKDNPKLHKNFLETLTGFLTADSKVIDFDDNRRSRYEVYQEKLKITETDNGQTREQTPKEYYESENYQLIKSLKSKLAELRLSGNSAPKKKEIGKEKVAKLL